MIYKKLSKSGDKWEVCAFDNTKQQIPLYDKINGVMVQTAIGLY